MQPVLRLVQASRQSADQPQNWSYILFPRFVERLLISIRGKILIFWMRFSREELVAWMPIRKVSLFFKLLVGNILDHEQDVRRIWSAEVFWSFEELCVGKLQIFCLHYSCFNNRILIHRIIIVHTFLCLTNKIFPWNL